jgi:hypothetical protein
MSAGIAHAPRWQTDPAKAGPSGVVCGTRVFLFANRDPWQAGRLPVGRAVELGEELEDLTALSRRALTAGIEALWLIPRSSSPSPDDPPIIREWAALSREDRVRAAAPDLDVRPLSGFGVLGSGTQAGLGIRRRRGEGPAGHVLRLHAPWIGDHWAIAEDLRDLPADPPERARTAMTGIALAAYALGVRLMASPSGTGMTLLRETLQSQHKEIAAPAEWAQELVTAHPIVPLEWARELGPEESAGDPVTVYTYDRNSSYVSSAREVPIGDPVPTASFVPNLPGLYRLSAAAPAAWPATLPGPFFLPREDAIPAYPAAVRDVWAWEPHIRLALAQGWKLEIHEGYYWPKERRIDLRVWHDRVWDARRRLAALHREGPAELRGAAAIASHIIKRAGVAAIGRLAQTYQRAMVTTAAAEAEGWRIGLEETDEWGEYTGRAEAYRAAGKTDLLRPEWRNTIIARANERLLSAAYGQAPADTIGAYVDCLYTTAEHPELAGDPLKVGGFRFKRVSDVPRADLLTHEPWTQATAIKRGGAREIDAPIESEPGRGE